MGFSLNKAQLIGQLGKDAETSFTASNLSVTKFSIATTHSKKDASGNWENLTTWHNVTAFSLNEYLLGELKKGKKFYIEGRIDHNSYEKDGVTKFFTSIICDFNGIIPLDKKDSTPNTNYGTEQGKTQQNSQEQTDDSVPF